MCEAYYSIPFVFDFKDTGEEIPRRLSFTFVQKLTEKLQLRKKKKKRQKKEIKKGVFILL